MAAQGLSGDLMFAQRPAAVAVLVAGETVAPGTEGHWSLSLLAHWQQQGVPVLRLHAQPVVAPSGAVPAEQAPTLLRCADAEDEAQQASAVILNAVLAERERGEAALPVALLALDRSAVRRMRAVLEGAGVRLADETGWRLSTTRAASALTRLVRAARPEATTEDWLDWLKSGWLPQEVDANGQSVVVADATAVFEAHCRKHQVLQAWAAHEDKQLPEVARVLVTWVQGVLAALHGRWLARGGRLSEWLLALQAALQSSGAWQVCQSDEAGWAAWQAVSGADATPDALAASPEAVPGAWAGLADKTRLDGHRFVRWVSDVMEATVFRPASPEQPDVVITTLARATLRPFAALVMPGGHLGQLGALEPVDPWLSGSWARSLNLSTPSERRAMQWEAWALLMHQPHMSCLVREGQGSEPLSPSPWLSQWSQTQGVALQPGTEPRQSQAVTVAPAGRPAPVLRPGLVPTRLTATAYEALRDCPYRYFAAHVLGLRSQDELEEGVDHADHGTWLHEVLRRFHTLRGQWPEGLSRAEALALWLRCVNEVAQEQGLTHAATRPYFAPYLADAERLGEVYLDWLATHEREGWQVQWMEHRVEAELRADMDGPLRLHGQIDRMDQAGSADGTRHVLIDYKTGNLTRLKAKVRTPDEDTQLAFYALLAQEAPPAQRGGAELPDVQAGYLHMHRDEVTLVPHDDVAETAQRLQQAIAVDWRRMQAGLGLAALGEGPACAHCEHAGLCRKAHWPVAVAATVSAADGGEA
jgi:ATP-dependent helicase/nuclease subunit B